jgi:tryptophan synthase alpha chain
VTLAETFERAGAEGRAVLIGYLPAGYPSREAAITAMCELVAAGVDVIEVGLPYSDPLMDGPVIQAAVEAALAAGTRTADVLATVAAVAATGTPTLVMTYWNPVERYGPARFAAALADAGAAGAITPDLLPEEAGPWLAALDDLALDPVFLVAPSSTDERIGVVGATNRGFVYAASTMGVTGARSRVSGRAAALVERVRRHTALPVAVGLGVSDAAQAAEVASFADGVIVGSAFVRRLADGGDLSELARDLAAGVRGEPGGP